MKAAIVLNCRAAWNGAKPPMESDDDAAANSYVAEYISRERLAKIGFRDDIKTLDTQTAEAFLKISVEFDKLEKPELKRKRK